MLGNKTSSLSLLITLPVLSLVDIQWQQEWFLICIQDISFHPKSASLLDLFKIKHLFQRGTGTWKQLSKPALLVRQATIWLLSLGSWPGALCRRAFFCVSSHISLCLSYVNILKWVYNQFPIKVHVP